MINYLKTIISRYLLWLAAVLIVLNSCATKKEVLYLQDIDSRGIGEIAYQIPTIQPNDILKISIESLSPEAAVPYNKAIISTTTRDLQLMQLDGYVVNLDHTVTLPILGKISTQNKTPEEFAEFLANKLITEGHLSDARVDVRLINAKVTVLGEVNKPGTFNYTDQNMTLLQALGYAGDLTITGERRDILITREVDGGRKVSHIDLTSAAFMNSEYYFIKPNDVIVVNPNISKVKNAGLVSNTGTVLTIVSLALSVTILLTR